MFVIKQDGPRYEIFDDVRNSYKLEEDWMIFVLGEIACSLSESEKFVEFVIVAQKDIIVFECFRSYSDMSVVVHHLNSFKKYSIKGAFHRDDVSLLVLDVLGALKAIMRESYLEFPMKAFYVKNHCSLDAINKVYSLLNFSEALKLMDEIDGIFIDEHEGVTIKAVSNNDSSFNYYVHLEEDREDEEEGDFEE